MLQKIESKIGEVSYRSKLVKQYQGKNNFFPNEPNQKQIISALKERLRLTNQDFSELKKLNMQFSPYLEIGAEFGHRSAFLETKYDAKGYALDISLESLQMASFFAKKFKLKKIPSLICADAYKLPFPDNSLNFIFCYQTLHHFPNPKPIIDEIIRVLKPNGYFFANEEPVSQSLNLNLWRRPTKLRSWEKFLKLILVLPFISKIGKTETEHKILENTFDLKTWQKSLKNFNDVTTWIKPFPFGPQTKVSKKTDNNWLKPSIPTNLFIKLGGGGIKILAKKSGASSIQKNWGKLPVCPMCKTALKGNICPKCKISYPTVRNIKIMLPKYIMNSLYPKFNNAS